MKIHSKFLAVFLVLAVAAGLVFAGAFTNFPLGGITPAAGQQGLPGADSPTGQDIQVQVDGKLLTFDVPPVVENGRTLVPLRALFESLGAQVAWDEATQTVTAAKGGLTVNLAAGSSTAYVNGRPVALDVPAKVVNGRTLVPLRFVGESLGAQVAWDEAARLVSVATAAGGEAVKVEVDGKLLSFDVPPVMESGRTLVPLRVLFESLGAEVAWDEASQTVTAVKGDLTVKLAVGSSTAYVNGSPVALDVPARIVKGRTLVPLRFVSESLGAQVAWDEAARLVRVATAPGEPTEEVAEKPATTASGSGGSGGGGTAVREELVIAVTRDFGGSSYPGGAWCEANIYEPLIFINEKLELKPGLAIDWERLDSNTWKIDLRKGVKYHNGKTFDANGAKYSLEYALSSKGNKYLKSRLDAVIDKIEVSDSSTLIITTKKPYLFMAHLLSHPYLAVLEQSAAEKGEIVGTGPFKYENHVADQYFSVVRNEDYWGDQKPKLQRIVFKNIPDPNTRILALQSGEVDLAVGLVGKSLKELQNFDLTVKGFPWASMVNVLSNRTKQPFDDVRMRKALYMAINKDAILSEIIGGYGVKGKSLVSAGFLYNADTKVNGYSYNPSEAKRLVEEAGYKDIEIKLAYYAPEAGFKEIAEAVQSYLKAIGINSQIIPWDANIYYGEYNSGNWDVCVDFRRIFFGSSSSLIHDAFYSKSGLCGVVEMAGISQEVDQMIESAMELEANKDIQKAAEKYIEVQRIALDEYAATCPIYYQQNVLVYKNGLLNVSAHPLMVFYNGATERALSRFEWK